MTKLNYVDKKWSTYQHVGENSSQEIVALLMRNEKIDVNIKFGFENLEPRTAIEFCDGVDSPQIEK